MDTTTTADLCFGIGDRILEVRGKMTQQAFANSLNIAKSTLIRYENGDRLPDAEVIARICERHHIDYTWLITGRGSRTEAERYVKVPQFDVAASAGMGAFVDGEAEVEMVRVDKDWLENQLKVRPEDASLIFVRGDSMMPTLNNGDVLLVSSNVEQIGDGIYVLHSDGLLQVKRLQRQPGGQLRVTSDNPAYQPYIVNFADESTDFRVVGKVVWTVHKVTG